MIWRGTKRGIRRVVHERVRLFFWSPYTRVVKEIIDLAVKRDDEELLSFAIRLLRFRDGEQSTRVFIHTISGDDDMERRLLKLARLAP